jgi:hypothetical protein
MKHGEWLNSWGNELEDMGGIVGELLFVELSGVESENKKDQRATQGQRTARETARLSSQTCQIVAQFGIIPLHREGLRLAFRNYVPTRIVCQQIVGCESIAVVHPRRWTLVDHPLHVHGIPFPDYIAANEAAGAPVYLGYDVDLLFFSPMKVNNSSNSAVSTSLGVGTWLIPLAYA